MSKLTLVIGNKNYSTWSLRPWLALKHTGQPFEEVVIPLYQPTSKAEILKFSPSGKVPALLHGETVVWESLAICEYLAELFPAAHLWPDRSEDRAKARAISAEMHAGFGALRQNLPMNLREKRPQAWVPPDARRDIERVVALWDDCRKANAPRGPFLFGPFSIVDAMFAPVVFRFEIYGVHLSGPSLEYQTAMLDLPAMQEWARAGRAETWRLASSD